MELQKVNVDNFDPSTLKDGQVLDIPQYRELSLVLKALESETIKENINSEFVEEAKEFVRYWSISTPDFSRDTNEDSARKVTTLGIYYSEDKGFRVMFDPNNLDRTFPKSGKKTNLLPRIGLDFFVEYLDILDNNQVTFVDTKVFESEYYNLFSNRIEEEDFPNELTHNKLLNYFKRKVKFLNSKDLFLEFDFSFEDVEPYKDKKFSLFYNTTNSSFSIYPISGSTIQIVDGFIVEEIVAKESGNKKIILNKFLLSDEEMIPYFIEEWTKKTINVLFNIIKFGNEKRIEFLDKMSKPEKSFSEKHSIITDMKSLEVNEFITKGLISDDGIFPFYLLEENQKLNQILMEQIKIIPENELSLITNQAKEFIYKKFKN